MTLGLLIGVSPWLEQSFDSSFVVLNAVVAGLLVLSAGGLQLVALQVSEVWFELAVGPWLAASPRAFHYAGMGTLTVMHVVLGELVAVLAAIELAHDRGRARGAA
jgi:NO-binding membrane sensor protein with MHYT domain